MKYECREWIGPDTYLLNSRNIGVEMSEGDLMLILYPGNVKCLYSMQDFSIASWNRLMKETRSLGYMSFYQYTNELKESINNRNRHAPDTVISDADARRAGVVTRASDDRGLFKIIRHPTY